MFYLCLSDILFAEEIEKSAHDFFMNSRLMNHQHQTTLEKERATPVESYIAPVTLRTGKPVVRTGARIVVSRISDDDRREEIKNGAILSYSIAGQGIRSSIDI